jgi:pyruvate/2-oxoglutarate/acetoin dehydrogenase E1 component
VAIVEQAAASQGIGPRLAAAITARFFDSLDAPPLCLASQDVPPPVSRVLEEAVLLGDEEILAGLQSLARRG